MQNNLFCGNKAQLSALIVSASKIGSIVGTVLAGIIPNKYGRKRPVQVIVVAHLVFYIMMIFTNNLSDYGIAFTLCEMCSAFIWTTLSVYGVEVRFRFLALSIILFMIVLRFNCVFNCSNCK